MVGRTPGVPFESLTRVLKGDPVRVLAVELWPSAACLAVSFSSACQDWQGRRPQLNVNQKPNQESNKLIEPDLLGTMRNRVPPQQTVPGPTKDLASVDFSDAPTPDSALADAHRRQNRAVPPPAPATDLLPEN